MEPVTVIGAGLAGSECAWQLARRGIPVTLREMKPEKMTPAHVTPWFAELCCSNSLRGAGLENAVGLLKEELRRLDSLILRCADATAVPAGGALAVDREGFARMVTEELRNHPLITVVPGEVTELPEGQVVVASGPSDIIGFSVFDKADGKLKYQSGAIMTNLLLADEINRTSSKTQSALLEAMEELQVTVDGVTRPLPKPFIVLATENPVGSAGTQMLPASQLDRFMLQLSMGYPNRASTAALLKDRHHVDPLSACQTVTTPAELEKLIAEVSNIHVADRIYDYIAELVDLTRSNAYVTLGVSPRGALAVTRAAKANAYLEGRDYVIPDDVCAVFPDVCVHRLILNSKARLQDYTAALILQNVLTSVQKPDIREFSSK